MTEAEKQAERDRVEAALREAIAPLVSTHYARGAVAIRAYAFVLHDYGTGAYTVLEVGASQNREAGQALRLIVSAIDPTEEMDGECPHEPTARN